jgi:hypothetical protein
MSKTHVIVGSEHCNTINVVIPKLHTDELPELPSYIVGSRDTVGLITFQWITHDELSKLTKSSYVLVYEDELNCVPSELYEDDVHTYVIDNLHTAINDLVGSMYNDGSGHCNSIKVDMYKSRYVKNAASCR